MSAKVTDQQIFLDFWGGQVISMSDSQLWDFVSSEFLQICYIYVAILFYSRITFKDYLLFFFFFLFLPRRKISQHECRLCKNSEAEDNHNRIARQMLGEAAPAA